MQKRKSIRKIMLLGLMCSSHVFAATVTVPMYFTKEKGQGAQIGTITLEDQSCGVLIKPDLHQLPNGVHGFHIHEIPNCSDKGMAAGGHYDPAKAKEHEGPYDKESHLGDLPILVVDKNGNATLPSLAPRITVKSIKGRAIIVHVGGDNYSDKPEKLGGGGARLACGIIPNGQNGEIVVPATNTETTETTTTVTSPETENAPPPQTGTTVTTE